MIDVEKMHINIGLSLNYLLQEFFLPGTSRNYGEKLKSVCILLNFSELSFIEHLGWLFLKKTIFVKNMSECFWRLNITNFFLLSVDTRHSVHWGATSPPSKPPPPLSCQAPLKSANCPSPLFLGNPLSILIFSEPPPHPTLEVGS